MKISIVAAAFALAGIATSAAAQDGDSRTVVGQITNTTDGVLVSHAGKLFPARSGQRLFKGDRVIAGANASAKIATTGCNVTLASISIVTMNGSCQVPQTLETN